MQNQNKSAGIVLPSQFIQGTPYLDPSITYTIQLVNAAADAIFRMCHVLDAVEHERFFGYYEQIEGYGCEVTTVVDRLIDFAAHFAKSTV